MQRRVIDLMNVLRGLEKVAQSTASLKKKELDQMCRQSSLKDFPRDMREHASSLVRQGPSRFTPQFVYDRVDLIGKSVQVIANELLPGLTQNLSRVVKIPPSLLPAQNPAAPSASLPFTSTDIETDDLLSSLEKMYGLSDDPGFTEDEVVHKSAQTTPQTASKPVSIPPAPPVTRVQEPIVKHQQTSSLPKKLLDDSSLSTNTQSKTEGRERSVPSSRIGRVLSFGNLAVGLGLGAAAEVTKRGLGFGPDKNSAGTFLQTSPFLSDANAERIVDTLCRVRGAALKLGQMLSIQDNAMINPQIKKIFERVRQSADFMPYRQMHKVLVQELGDQWRDKFASFEDKPFASASIGQVHKGVTHDGRQVAVKIQYPGVASSIDSDINNLMGILSVWKILPTGLYMEKAIDTARHELTLECDYKREAEYGALFSRLLKDDPVFQVPEIIWDLSTKQVLTTEFVEGVTLDKCTDLDQGMRDWIGEQILRLCLKELFIHRHMQTDPNWSNFLYSPKTGKITLLDFGASREFPKKFVDDYLRVIHAASLNNREGIIKYSQRLGFLTGFESKTLEDAHVEAITILGEAFSSSTSFDFGRQRTTARIQKLVPVMLEHRLCPPPEETYSLHRKMSGCFLLCTHLASNITCRSLFLEILDNYKYDTEP